MVERKRNKSKAKGNKWENSVYDNLRDKGLWVRKNKGSGSAEDNKGDIETYNLLIECKHHKSVTMKQLQGWMSKIYKEAIDVNKFPILIVKENYKRPRTYFINEEGEICFMYYDVWLDNVVSTTETSPKLSQKIPLVEKMDIPNYIG